MLSIGATELILPSNDSEFTDLERWVCDNINPSESMPWLSRAFPGRRLAKIAWPTGYRPARPVKLNSYFYPYWGACRFGYGHFLCSTNQAKTLRNESWGDDGLSPPTPMTLLMDTDGLSIDGNFHTEVFVLRVIPLDHVDPPPGKEYENGLYLVTVVDERFFWWYKSYPNGKAQGSEDWTSIITKCATVLDMPLGPDPIAPEYLKADGALCDLFGEVVPPILDAACYNIGMRLVRIAIGTYHIAGAAAEIDRHRNKQKAWSLRAGDDFFQEAL